MDKQEIIGLIAGNGQFPILFAKNARDKKMKVVAVGIKGDTSFFLRFFCDKIFWVGAGDLRKLFDFFKSEGIKKVIMAGQVNPDNLFDNRLILDEEFKKIFAALKDRKADTIFLAVADKLRQEGMELVDSTLFLKDFMAPKGTLTRRGPTECELADIEFGRGIAKDMGSLDVGQTVVIKGKAIVAIEAMEGTDQAILRGGTISKQGAVVIKVSKPKQNNRFDIPVIGPRTIQSMMKCKASCLAVEAGKTLIINQSAVVRLADRAKISLVAF